MSNLFTPNPAESVFNPGMMPMNLTPSQKRNMKIQQEFLKFCKVDNNEITDVQDQYIYVKPDNKWPGKVSAVTALQAATMIVDGQATLATKQQIEDYETQNGIARDKVMKLVAKKDLTQALSTVIRG